MQYQLVEALIGLHISCSLFNKFQFSNGEDGDSNICESLELLILKYQADPDELIEIMAEIRELCPNLKCIVVQADFEDKDSIRDVCF